MLALTACEGTTHSTTHSAPSSAAPPSAALASAVAPSPLDSGTEGQMCAAINALAAQSDPIGTAARAFRLTRDQVVQAISDRCPTSRALRTRT